MKFWLHSGWWGEILFSYLFVYFKFIYVRVGSGAATVVTLVYLNWPFEQLTYSIFIFVFTLTKVHKGFNW